MWVSSTSPPNLSLISPLTTEIYYWTGITGNAHRQTHTETEFDPLPIQEKGLVKNQIQNAKTINLRYSVKRTSDSQLLSLAQSVEHGTLPRILGSADQFPIDSLFESQN